MIAFCGFRRMRIFYESACRSIATDDIRSDLIGVVPGAFYRTHRNTGADGVRVLAIAHKLGCEAELIPVRSFGRLEENADIILDWIDLIRGYGSG